MVGRGEGMGRESGDGSGENVLTNDLGSYLEYVFVH